MYCYDLYHANHKNPALCVLKEYETDSLLKYYQEMENGIMTPTFNFPINEVPLDTCVYVLKYLKDSTIAKVVFFNDKKGYENEVTAFVYVGTLHAHE